MKQNSPHRFGIYLGAAIVGYFLCGFVAKRVLAEEAPVAPPVRKEVMLAFTQSNVWDLQNKLNEGYTVKTLAGCLSHGDISATPVWIAVLVEPMPGYLAQLEAQRQAKIKADFDKRRAEYLANQPKVEKAKEVTAAKPEPPHAVSGPNSPAAPHE